MKLALDGDEDEEERPGMLTLHFFAGLMISEAKKKGVVQLLNLKRKRERVYSTKISDGFFQVKVMVVQEAAKQLELEQIADYYILEGAIRNHGDGVIVIKEKLRFWKYARPVGCPVAWKLKKENINPMGSNFIMWSSQEMENKLQIFQRTQSPLKEQLSQRKVQEPLLKKQFETSGKRGNKRTSLSQMTQTLSLEVEGMQIKQKVKEVSVIVTEVKKLGSSDTQSLEINPRSQRRKSDRKDQKPMSMRMQNFLQNLFDSDEEDNTSSPVEQKSAFKSNKKKERSAVKEEEDLRVDLQFIFNCMGEEEQKESTQVNGNLLVVKSNRKMAQDDSEDDVDGFLQWFNTKNDKKPEQKVSLRGSMAKQKQEMYKYLMSSSQSEGEDSKSKMAVKNAQIGKQNQLIDGLTLLKFQDVYHGVSFKSCTWCLDLIIKCISLPFPKDYVHAIFSDLKGNLTISGVLVNYSVLLQGVEEGGVYRVGKGIIKTNLQHNRWNISHCEIQLDCSKCLIQKLEGGQPLCRQSSDHYQPISKIYEMDDGEVLSIFGLVKSIRNISAKNGNISNYQIVDPIIKYSVSLTKFDSPLKNSQIPQLINSAITIYNAGVSSYKGKKNIVAKPKTIIKYHWLPLTQEGDEVRLWIQNQNNRVEDVELNLVGFHMCLNLSRIPFQGESQIYVRNVTVLDFSQNYQYLACVKCFKKIQNGYCRTCGKRGVNDTMMKLFIRGNIADSTTVFPVIWSESFAQIILVQSFKAFETLWLLKKVQVWLERGSNGNLTIIKAKPLEPAQKISSLFSFIKNSFL